MTRRGSWSMAALLTCGPLPDRQRIQCILYEMVTGEKPFMLEDEEAIFRRQAPDEVSGCLRQQWLVYDAFAMAQRNRVGLSLPPLLVSRLSVQIHICFTCRSCYACSALSTLVMLACFTLLQT